MWKAEDSLELYGIENWGNGYFSVNDKGNIIIMPNKDRAQSMDIMDLIEEIEKSKDLEFPVLLRFLRFWRTGSMRSQAPFWAPLLNSPTKGPISPSFP